MKQKVPVFTIEKTKELIALSVEGKKLPELAEYFGVDRKTIYYHLKKFEKTGRVCRPYSLWRGYERKESPWCEKEYVDENRPKHENPQFLYNEYAKGKGEFINRGRNYAEYFVKNEKNIFRTSTGK